MVPSLSSWRRSALPLVALSAAVACRPAPSSAKPDASPPPLGSATVELLDAAVPTTSVSGPEPREAGPGATDPMAIHLESKEALLALFSIRRPPRRDSNADGFLLKSFGVDSSRFINQGNKALAKHGISQQACLAGLSGITLQTEDQRRICGFDNMVPILRHGKDGKAKKIKSCIDIFEFPNKACELPMVWVAPVQAKVICELQGKRLCSQEEWTVACKADPEGGKDWSFAYGDEMDLEICNTNKPAKKFGPGCVPDSAKSAWKTCATNTEPSGSFPRCRSRLGVFDQHGNVAEIMTRRDPDGETYSQLKGSAFFYPDVARKPNEHPPEGRETYPDHCAYDPRWHVEAMSVAWHVNYHLGFRCCKSVH